MSSITSFHVSPPAFSRNHVLAHTIDFEIPPFYFDVEEFFRKICESKFSPNSFWFSPSWFAQMSVARSLYEQDQSENDATKTVMPTFESPNIKNLFVASVSKNGLFGNLNIKSFETHLRSKSSTSIVALGNKQEVFNTRYVYALIFGLCDRSSSVNSIVPDYYSSLNFDCSSNGQNANNGFRFAKVSSDTFTLQYYLFRVDTENINPYTESHSSAKNSSWESLEGLLYQQVIPEVNSSIHQLVESSVITYRRDCLWRNILTADATHCMKILLSFFYFSTFYI